MRAETQKTVDKIEKSLDLLAQRLDWETAPYRLEEFNARVEDPNLWNDPTAAQKLMRDRQMLVDAMETYRSIKQDLQDGVDLIELGEMEDDAAVVAEAEAALKQLAERAAKKELEALLDGEADANDTFLEINAGAGGQHVNTTDSAVRITHIPTGIVVTSSEKSQHQNRDIAMKALKSRLYQMELDRRNAEINAAHEAKGDAGWGNQIRSYVLQPYQMVKDLRTGVETSDTQGVLDGDLDQFMAATLAQNVAGKSRADARGED